jgi:hypothetical protein
MLTYNIIILLYMSSEEIYIILRICKSLFETPCITSGRQAGFSVAYYDDGSQVQMQCIHNSVKKKLSP